MAGAKKSDPKTYTNPELRDKIKEQITAGDKGGNPGQWSARKAQLVTHEYEKQGGKYKKPRNESQKSLKNWGEEKWTTADGKPAKREGKMERYLPEKAWDKLSPAEKKATKSKKVEGSKQGKQFVGNTPAAAKARKAVTKKKPAAKTVLRKTATKASTKRGTKETASKATKKTAR